MIPAPISNFLQSYFDKIFVITIERATDRQSEVINQLEGLPFEFFYGVDKKNAGLGHDH
jgi:glycosyl transferase family 25